MNSDIIAASLAVGETRGVPAVCDSAGDKRYCETPPVSYLGVIGVHRRACRIKFRIV